HVVAGDLAEVLADGTLRLVGRGSLCINTGGEKVYPEEVEEALKSHPTVRDAVVVGVPDERFGESVAALVEPIAGASPTTEELQAAARGLLAGSKVPRNVVLVETTGRAANGTADYGRLRKVALAQLGLT